MVMHSIQIVGFPSVQDKDMEMISREDQIVHVSTFSFGTSFSASPFSISYLTSWFLDLFLSLSSVVCLSSPVLSCSWVIQGCRFAAFSMLSGHLESPIQFDNVGPCLCTGWTSKCLTGFLAGPLMNRSIYRVSFRICYNCLCTGSTHKFWT